MAKPTLMILCHAAVLGGLLCSPVSPTFAKEKPNILIVLADDLGYGDLACYGHPIIKTPNIDRFAKEGLRLTSCYSASANCSPARTGLMTGRTPYRVGVHSWIPFDSPMHVGKDETMIAKVLKGVGYETCHVGKWHMSGNLEDKTQPQPGDHGFDHWFSTQNNALPSHANPDNFVRNGEPVGPLKGYAAPIVAGEAIDWLTTKRNKELPFFMFVCFHEPHEPIASDKRFTDMYKFEGKPSPFDPRVSQQSAHHGNVTQLDFGFGMLMKAIDDLKLADDTFVFFTSDNGPAVTGLHPFGSAGPLREKKGYMYEGGIRVPGIVRWPGHVKAETKSDAPISGVDLLPTLCELTGAALPTTKTLDGASFLPVFKAAEIRRTKPLYWQFNFARGAPRVVVRQGNWKLLAEISLPGKPGGDIVAEAQASIKKAELTKFELYNVHDDIGETKEMSEAHPTIFVDLKRKMQQMYEEVRAESPTWPAWEWPRLEGARINALRKRLADEAKSKEEKPKDEQPKESKASE